MKVRSGANKKKYVTYSQAIDDYYILSDICDDDIEMSVSIIQRYHYKHITRSKIRLDLENLNLSMYHATIEKILEMPSKDVIRFIQYNKVI